MPPHFHYIDRQQCCFNLVLCSSYSPNQSRNSWCRTHIPHHRGFWILTAGIQIQIRFIVSIPVIFAGGWIMQVPIPVKPIFGVWNAFGWAILINLSWIAVDSFDLADIQYLTSSTREVLCRQSWWHRWFFRQFKCSRTIMMKVSPGCFDDLFSIWNLSYGSTLFIMSARFLLCSS